jgi:hypothetical protein
VHFTGVGPLLVAHHRVPVFASAFEVFAVLRITCCRAAPVATLAIVESWQVDVLALAYQHEFARTRRVSVIAVGHLPTLKCAVQHN